MREVPVLSSAQLSDEPEQWPVVERAELMRNPIFAMRRDSVQAPDGAVMERDYVAHPGAVGVIALDEDDHVVLVRQYRHPAGLRMIEPPAGILDHPGEDPQQAAARELAEEAELAATDWRVLVDVFTSPGALQESARVYLARGLHDAPRPDGFVVEHEEAFLDVVRAPVDEIVNAVLAGRMQSPLLVAGILALAAARAKGGEQTLRAADAPWPARQLWERVDKAR